MTGFASRLAHAFAEPGWPVHGPRDDRERAGIVAFEPPCDPEVAWRRLSDEGFSLSLRGGRLRAAPHVYNTVGEIDELVDAVARIAR